MVQTVKLARTENIMDHRGVETLLEEYLRLFTYVNRSPFDLHEFPIEPTNWWSYATDLKLLKQRAGERNEIRNIFSKDYCVD